MMWSRHWWYLVFLPCVFVSLVVAQQTAPSNVKPEDQILQLERDWLAADGKGDAARLQEIIADDFVGSSLEGNLLTKVDIIPMRAGPGGFAGAVATKTNVRVFGNTGVLMGVIHNPQSPQWSEIRVTLVCQKRARGWQIIAAQLSLSDIDCMTGSAPDPG